MEWEKAKEIMNSNPEVAKALEENEKEYQMIGQIICLEIEISKALNLDSIHLAKVDNEDYYIVKIDNMPGLMTGGKDFQELIVHIKEAITSYNEALDDIANYE